MKRHGFTLIELLIVITILIMLTGLTISVYSMNQGAERMRAASRQLQSAILGARDRAIHSGHAYGIRLISDSANPKSIISLQYVSQVGDYTEGFVEVWQDANGQLKQVRAKTSVPTGYPKPDWYALKTAGVLNVGNRIRLSAQGSWYRITDTSLVTPTTQTLVLSNRFRSAPVDTNPANPATLPMDYILELSQSPAPGEQPILLASGIAIDATFSENLPTTKPYDFFFSARGTPLGWLAAKTHVHFLLSEIADIEAGSDPSKREGETAVVSIQASGAVQSYSADLTDANSDGKADDLFRFAETGQTAGK